MISRLAAPSVIDTPRTGAGECQVEEGKTVEHLGFAAIEQREEAARGADHEIGHRHFARQDEGGRPGEQADQQQQTANQFDDAGHPDQRERLQIVKSGVVREGEELRHRMLEVEQRHHDAEHAQDAWRPDGSDVGETGHRCILPEGT
jgi:hypothetical protein